MIDAQVKAAIVAVYLGAFRMYTSRDNTAYEEARKLYADGRRILVERVSNGQELTNSLNDKAGHLKIGTTETEALEALFA